MFENPSFHFWGVFYTALGAGLFWAKWGREKLKAYYLSDMIEMFVEDERWRAAIEFVLFLAIGCFVAIGIVKPHSAPQAFTAGLGWTGLVATHRRTV